MATAEELHDGEQQAQPGEKAANPTHKLSTKKLAKLQDAYNRRGIIYISRIPPHLVRNA